MKMAGRETGLHVPVALLRVDDAGVHLRQPGPLWGLVLRPEARPWLRGSWLHVPWSHVHGAVQYPLGFVVDLPDDDALVFHPLMVVGHRLADAVRARGDEVRRRLLSARWKDLRLYRNDHLDHLDGKDGR